MPDGIAIDAQPLQCDHACGRVQRSSPPVGYLAPWVFQSARVFHVLTPAGSILHDL